MATVRIPTPLRPLCGGNAQVNVPAATLREALATLEARFPGVRARLQGADGEIRRFVNVFVNAQDVRDRDGLDTPLADADTVTIIPAIAGGRP